MSSFPFPLNSSHWEGIEGQGKSAKGSSAWGAFADASSAQRSVNPKWIMPSTLPLISEAHIHLARPNAGYEEFADMHDAFGVNFISLPRSHFCCERKLCFAKSK